MSLHLSRLSYLLDESLVQHLYSRLSLISHPRLNAWPYRLCLSRERERHMSESIAAVMLKEEYARVRFVGVLGARHCSEVDRRVKEIFGKAARKRL